MEAALQRLPRLRQRRPQPERSLQQHLQRALRLQPALVAQRLLLLGQRHHAQDPHRGGAPQEPALRRGLRRILAGQREGPVVAGRVERPDRPQRQLAGRRVRLPGALQDHGPRPARIQLLPVQPRHLPEGPGEGPEQQLLLPGGYREPVPGEVLTAGAGVAPHGADAAGRPAARPPFLRSLAALWTSPNGTRWDGERCRRSAPSSIGRCSSDSRGS